MQEIAEKFGCSSNKVAYWMARYSIPRRSISDAVYQKANSQGDPFTFILPKTKDEAILFGLGIGLFWGEGTKASKTSVRLGNTDPYLIEKFVFFLETFFSIKRESLKFGLQIFSDLSEVAALKFWTERLGVQKTQFYKTIITPYRSIGNYRKKSEWGVVTIYFNNVKMRNILIDLIEQQKGGSLVVPKKPL